MATIYRRKDVKRHNSWRLQFRAKVRKSGKTETFSAFFYSYEEAQEFAEKWEPIFFREGKDAIPYNWLEYRRKKKWGDRY